MIYFKQLLESKIRSRRNMPQIDNFEDFMKDIVTIGYKIISKSVDVDSLKPTQHDFNDEKIKAILDKKSYNSKPIIITNDDYILDGHHRWKACCQAKDSQDVIQIDLDFENLYDLVKDKDYVSYKEIHENYSTNSSFGNYASGLSRGLNTKELDEDGEGGAVASGGETSTTVNSVSGVASTDIPLFKNVNKRKELEK